MKSAPVFVIPRSRSSRSAFRGLMRLPALALGFVLVLTHLGVSKAQGVGGWPQWLEAFLALGGDPGLSDVTGTLMPDRLAAIVTLTPKSGRRCGEDFAVSRSDQVASGYGLALAPPGAACEMYRFGMIDLELTRRTASEINGLRARLTKMFGEPTVRSVNDRRRADHWQVAPSTAIELQFDPKDPGRKAGLTLANVPPELQPHAGASKPRL